MTPTVELNFEVHGSGPPVVLLHGFPETHVCWDAVTECLASTNTVIRPDLRGYGESPMSVTDFSKRAMADDVVALATRLGYEQFAVVGHDRGGLVGQRLALDHPDAVTHLAVLDIVPVLDMWESINADVALSAWHLFFLSQPAPLPEKLLGGSSAEFVDHFLDGWSTVPGAITVDARRAYHEALARPEAIHAVCEDYRAGASVDLEHDRADRRAGRRISVPVTVLWQEPGGQPAPFDPVAIWSGWADSVDGCGLDCGHFIPEERPAEVANAVKALLKR
jgi:haloacetate dehalogenase